MNETDLCETFSGLRTLRLDGEALALEAAFDDIAMLAAGCPGTGPAPRLTAG